MFDIVTLEEYKTAKAITSPTKDNQISLYLSLANATVAKYLGMTILRSPEVDKYPDIISGNVVFCKGSIDSITVTTLPDNRPIDVLKIQDTFAYIGESLNSQLVEIAVTYAPYNVDSSVKLAVISLCDYYLNSEYRVSSSMSGTSVQQPKVDTIPPHIRTILNLNRIM